MSTLLIAIPVLLLAGVAGWALTRRRGSPPPADLAQPTAQPPRSQAARPAPTRPASSAAAPADLPQAAPAAPSAAPAATRPRLPAAQLPPALAGLKLVPHEKLPAGQVDALVAKLHKIPRPPMSLQKLVSPAFLEKAGSGELSDLVMAEAQIAAKVLATVNSPVYGLRKPVGSVGQAVTFLGLNSVRSICLRYMLDDSFKTSSLAHQQRYDHLLRASALSSELCSRLVAKLGLSEPGALVTQGVLSFLGQLATTSLLPTDSPAWGPHELLAERVAAEQAQLGLGAGEIGGLLMQAWGLPDSIVADVRDIDTVLVTPADEMDPRRGPRLALCYLCARLGERLALGTLDDLASFDPADEASPDFFHLQGYLAAPMLARLGEALQSPAVLQPVRQLMGRVPATA